jgi:hypothetical protein
MDDRRAVLPGGQTERSTALPKGDETLRGEAEQQGEPALPIRDRQQRGDRR